MPRGPSRDAAITDDLRSADALFRTGNFDAARRHYTRVLREEPGNPVAALALGHLALLSNRLPKARGLLSALLEPGPNAAAAGLLADTFYRGDDFARAAPLFRTLGREAMARKLESFEGVTPYLIQGPLPVRLKFLQRDPLPLVQLAVSGSDPGFFLLDTGGSEIILDTDFAQRCGARTLGDEIGTFGGGQQAAYGHGRVDSVEFEGVSVRNVPVHLTNLRRLSEIAGGRRLNGILGTVFLHHFTPTIDYPGRELVLYGRDSTSATATGAPSGDSVAVPFWMEKDHFLLVRGAVNHRPLLLFLDSGLAGGGFTCPESTLGEAGIRLRKGRTLKGPGGGGMMEVVPFTVDSLSVGGVTKKKVTGLFGAFPPSLENEFGFRVGGLVSHEFLRSYRVTFDFRRMLLFLDSSTS